MKPSWHGESVGRYEGDTLVVDTFGQNGESFVDNFRPGHATQLHVVERFKSLDGDKNLQATITLDEPGALNMSWSAIQRSRRRANRLIAEVI
jgi:hypothetical protein